MSETGPGAFTFSLPSQLSSLSRPSSLQPSHGNAMTIGQLWYGWAPLGAEGRNQFQIIAASGALHDRSQVATQAALECCRRPTESGFGWYDRDGLRVVFSRNPTGEDGRGRPGNFFVHALVARPSSLPTEVLDGLWNSGLWVRVAPAEAPAQLDAWSDAAQFPMTAAPRPSHEAAVRALAGYLANVLQFSPSALGRAPQEAVAIAASIARAMPLALGLVSFVTSGDHDGTERYDVLGTPPSGPYRPLSDEPSAEAIAAAHIILDAAAGDARATEIVASLTRQSISRIDLVERLVGWTRIDTPVNPVSASHALAFVGNDEHLLSALVSSPGIVSIATAAATGDREAATFIRAAARLGHADRLVQAILHPLREAVPATAAESILILAEQDLSVASRLALCLAKHWAATGVVGMLTAQQRISLVAVLAAGGVKAGPAVDGLLGDARVAADALADRHVPARWRVRSLAAFSTQLAPRVVVAALAADPDLTRAVFDACDEHLMSDIERALEAASLAEVRAITDQARPLRSVIVRASCDRWLRRSLCANQASDGFLQEVESALERRTAEDEQWPELLVTATVQAIRGGSRSSPMPLPRPRRTAYLLGSLPGRSPRAVAFTDVAVQLAHLASLRSLVFVGQVEPVLNTARRLQAHGTAADGDAVAEWVVDCVVAIAPWPIWIDVIERVAANLDRSPAHTADRVARSALRDGRPVDVAACAAVWDAWLVCEGRADGALLKSELHSALARMVPRDLRAWLDDQARLIKQQKVRGGVEKERRGQASRWLAEVASGATQRWGRAGQR